MNDIRYPVPYGTMREWMEVDDDGIAKRARARGKKRRTELPCFLSLAELAGALSIIGGKRKTWFAATQLKQVYAGKASVSDSTVLSLMLEGLA